MTGIQVDENILQSEDGAPDLLDMYQSDFDMLDRHLLVR
jgi:hypothetical protein